MKLKRNNPISRGQNKELKSYEDELRIFLRQPQYKNINPSQELVFIFRNSLAHEVYLYKTNSQESLLKLWNDYHNNSNKFGILFSLCTSVKDAKVKCNNPRGPIAGYTLVDYTDKDYNEKVESDSDETVNEETINEVDQNGES